MPYPLSSDVSSGQPTAAAHYNNLRRDALYFGQQPGDAVAAGELLGHYQENLRLERLGSNRLRVAASYGAPVMLVIDGAPLKAVSNVDLPAGSAPSGAANLYFVFAVRSPGSTTFSLDINTSADEAANRRWIGRFYWNGTAIEPASVRTEQSVRLAGLLNYHPPQVCCCRLTAVSGEPLPAGDQTSVGAVYITPFLGNQVSLYIPGHGWEVFEFTELTFSLAGIEAGANRDLFLYYEDGAVKILSSGWIDNTTRSTPLACQDGVWVRANDPARRYLGSLRTTAPGLTEDSHRRRLIYNACNQRMRPLRVIEAANSWSYNQTTIRPWNNNLENRVELLMGLNSQPVFLEFLCSAKTAAASGFASVLIGLDNAESNHAQLVGFTTNTEFTPLTAVYHGFPGSGYHFLQLLERGNTSGATFTGDNNVAWGLQSGAAGYLYA